MSVNNAVRGVLDTMRSTNEVREEVLGTEINLAGVSFEGRQDYISGVDSRTNVRLQREKDNPHDSNAVSVVMNKDGSEIKLGYIPKKLNSSIASLLDSNTDLTVKVRRVVGGDFSNKGVIVVIKK